MNINKSFKLSNKLFKQDIDNEPIRVGFGRGLLEAGKKNNKVVALCADLTESTHMMPFKETYPDRFVEIGVAEQNLVTVASGLSAVGKIPFATSYASFSPGRNWEQIRTTICLNERNVNIVGSHAGLSVGPDGATHQMLEDIALMRVLPNMVVIVPADSHEAHKATMALVNKKSPSYIRLARESTAVVTTADSPFSIGKAQVLCSGDDVSIIACGPMVYEALKAALVLKHYSVSAEVINCSTIKPLDVDTVTTSVKKTRRVITVEEAQSVGGLGGAISELVSSRFPVPVVRLGVQDRFGQSGEVAQLWHEYSIDDKSIVKYARELVKKVKQR